MSQAFGGQESRIGVQRSA